MHIDLVRECKRNLKIHHISNSEANPTEAPSSVPLKVSARWCDSCWSLAARTVGSRLEDFNARLSEAPSLLFRLPRLLKAQKIGRPSTWRWASPAQAPPDKLQYTFGMKYGRKSLMVHIDLECRRNKLDKLGAICLEFQALGPEPMQKHRVLMPHAG